MTIKELQIKCSNEEGNLEYHILSMVYNEPGRQFSTEKAIRIINKYIEMDYIEDLGKFTYQMTPKGNRYMEGELHPDEEIKKD